MATLQSYSATIDALAPLVHYRFNETAGSAASDSADDLDGSYRNGVELGAAGTIGDGAIRLDGTDDVVVLDSLAGSFRVAVLGDSLADNRGADGNYLDAFSTALNARGVDASVLDHAVGGDRTAAGLARIAAVVEGNPDVVLVELGTNDAIGQVELETVESNLRSIITTLQRDLPDSEILLAGALAFYPDRRGGVGYGTEETRDAFEQIFVDVAGDLGVTLLETPDGSDKFLGGAREGLVITGGVLGDPTLHDDGLHPNPTGVDLVVKNTLPQTLLLGAAAGVIENPVALAEGSFEVWFSRETFDGRRSLFSTAGMLSGQVHGNGRVAIILAGEEEVFDLQSAPGAAAPATPVHLVFTFGAEGMHLFVDGAEIASNGFTSGLAGNLEPLVIGAEATFSTPGGSLDALQRFFPGTIDEFVLYQSQLDADEVAALFAAGEQGDMLIGTAADDDITGGSADETLRGSAGNDVLRGGQGGDAVFGGAGADVLRGGQGEDVMTGGAGADTLTGGAGNDQLFGNGGRDTLQGKAGADMLDGGRAADTARGGPGADLLFGANGIDLLFGGAGPDDLDGQRGPDVLTGGAGADTLRMSSLDHGVDKVRDFTPEDGDVLDLSALLDGFGDGSDPADFVALSETGGNTRVAVNADGAGADAVPVFTLVGVVGLDLGQLVDDGNLALAAPASS